jgi:uncharacterized protein (TIGR02001 family)
MGVIMQLKALTATALAAGMLAVSGMAHAQFSSTITVTSDYDFRGFSQSAKDPALQASLDYAFGETGWSAGIWGSNVDFDNDDDLEVDYYVNYAHSLNDALSIGGGVTIYDYPSGDDTRSYWEANAALNAQGFAGKIWYADDYLGIDESAWYLDANYNLAVNDMWSFQFHAGYSFGDAWDDDVLGGELFDYALGATLSWENFNFNLKFTGTDASGDQKLTQDVGNNEGRVVFSVATTLPWGE